MTTDLIARLRECAEYKLREAWRRSDGGAELCIESVLATDAADALSDLQAENQRLREALAWYGEQSRLARLIHSEGDAGRRNLGADGGSRARAALRSTEASHD